MQAWRLHAVGIAAAMGWRLVDLGLALILEVNLLVPKGFGAHVHCSGGEEQGRIRLLVVYQTRTDTCANRRFAVAAEALREQARHFAVSEGDVAEALRLHALLRALS